MQSESLQPKHGSKNSVAQSVLVLGGGFAGVETAIGLRRKGFSVTLVSERRFLFVYPTSIWVVTGEHQIEQDLMDLEDVARMHHFELVVGNVEGISASNRSATVNGRELAADILVLALGAARKPLPGLSHTTTVWGKPDDTVLVHQRIMELVKKGEGRIAVGFGGNPADSSAVRGGPAFEVMFNIDHFLKRLGIRERFQLTFFAPMANPGIRMGKAAAASVRKQLESIGVEIQFGRKLEGFDAQGVKLEGGARIDADLVVYIPAGTGHPVLAGAGLPLNDAGFVRIDGSCRVEGHPQVYAVGDIAALEGPDWKAKQGHLAEVMAKVATDAIEQRSKGQETHISYLEHLSLVCLMDSGNGGALVYRDASREHMIALPIVGHWLKKAWGYYYRFTKYNLIFWLAWVLRQLFSKRRVSASQPASSQ